MRVRWRSYAVLASMPQVAAYAVWPLAVARKGRRHGWKNGRPRPRNLLGLLPIGMGAALITWGITGHSRQESPDVDITLVPDYLVEEGAYSVSRNPLYLGGAMLWTGWSVLYGNRRVAAVGSGWFLFVSRAAVPLEERILHDKFGHTYDVYRARVPRWIDISSFHRVRVRPHHSVV